MSTDHGPESAADDGGIWFLKGHGTENDFILIPDRAGGLTLSSAQIQALCDRRAGIGGDGILRIAPDRDGGFFMDYRNADGSLAQMCGNGARVFARFLYDHGWVPAGPFSFGTRGGVRRAAQKADGQIEIGMGQVTVGQAVETYALMHGGEHAMFSGVAVDVGNPHLVVITDRDIADFDLAVGPNYSDADFPDGVNIEFVNRSGRGAVSMRVHERGVGETRSCGTGTVAVGAAYLATQGRESGEITVRVPGGEVTVQIGAHESTLTGPAVIVGSGTIDPRWWTRIG